MTNKNQPIKGYTISALLGAIAGGFIVLIATKALPKMIGQIMSGMMENMMSQMRSEGCDPAEI